MNEQDRVILFARFVNYQFSAFCILFELITGFKPPKLKELLKLGS